MNNNLSDALFFLFAYLIPMQIPSVGFFYGLSIFFIKIKTNRGIAKLPKHIAIIWAIVFFTAVLRFFVPINDYYAPGVALIFYGIVLVLSVAGAYVSTYRLVDIQKQHVTMPIETLQSYEQAEIEVATEEIIESLNPALSDSEQKYRDILKKQILRFKLPDKDVDYKSLSIQELVQKQYFSVKNEGGVMYLLLYSGHVGIQSDDFLKVFNSFEECKTSVETNAIHKLHPPGSVLTIEISALFD
jgi:hypothetical protein